VSASDVRDALELIVELASTEWQEADGSRKGATDNQGRRLYFVAPDLIEEGRAALAGSSSEPPTVYGKDEVGSCPKCGHRSI
jgi:hypothetical protein